jgi:hypothetical protein
MKVQVSPEAAGYVAARGGSLWVWAHRPAMCCNGTPAAMKAGTSPPKDPTGFTTIPADGIDVLFRPPGGRYPDVLEIDMRGRRHPRIEAYWDGCLIMM